MRWLIVERDLPILSVSLADVLAAADVQPSLSILEFFVVDDHLVKYNYFQI